jgi:beta-lactamase class D
VDKEGEERIRERWFVGYVENGRIRSVFSVVIYG